jgi:hypothetical protein
MTRMTAVELHTLRDDAAYVADELARGDAVPPEVLAKAKPYIKPLMEALEMRGTDNPKVSPAIALEEAMIDLMIAIAPVTVQSLRDTDTSDDRPSNRPVRMSSPDAAATDAPPPDLGSRPAYTAVTFSRQLIAWALLFLLAAIAVTALSKVSPPKVLGTLLELSLPVLYGGLGACVLLLRTLHKHIHDRTFDRRYEHEYYNRIILGVVSGGVVTVLVQTVPSADPVKGLASAPIAFIIGYNTDLLFSLIERISNALFPKVPDPPTVAVIPQARTPANGTGNATGEPNKPPAAAVPAA